MATFDDLAAIAQNLVIAINGLSKNYSDHEGQASLENVTAATLVKTGRGRVARICVTTAGTTAGGVYDAQSTSLAVAATLLASIPNTVGVLTLLLPVENGLVVTPGSGQVVSVSYS